MIRTLIAEDSASVRRLLYRLLDVDPDIEIVGQARDGQQAVEMTAELRPDVVTMDIRMPKLDGFEATRRIMTETPTPIVIVSGHIDVREVEVAMRAIEAGALTLLPKPVGPANPDFERAARRFTTTVKGMSAVKVVHRWRNPAAPAAPGPTTSPPAASPPENKFRSIGGTGSRRAVKAPKVVAIAASTGGPAALQQILSGLGAAFPLPILVVQHIGKGFAEGLQAWLDSVVELQVRIALQGEHLAPNLVYLAPDDLHLGVSRGGRIRLSTAPPRGSFRPSADVLFDSVADVFGSRVIAIILTGMGRDGVEGLASVRRQSGHIVAQDRDTSLVFGMPGEAIAAGLADRVLPLPRIAPYLNEYVDQTLIALGESHGRSLLQI